MLAEELLNILIIRRRPVLYNSIVIITLKVLYDELSACKLVKRAGITLIKLIRAC